jgi:protein-tyrosine-phosphatase
MKVLFKCKGNICRSPAAEAYLRMRRPHWRVQSVATTSHCQGQFTHPEMVLACRDRNIPIDGFHKAKYEGQFDNLDNDFDCVFDLHEAGIQDPYKTGNFEDALQEIIDFIDNNIINP